MSKDIGYIGIYGRYHKIWKVLEILEISKIKKMRERGRKNVRRISLEAGVNFIQIGARLFGALICNKEGMK
ncbi:MAG: hypothetical protein RSD97_09170 [Lachnospiraceae bacterium]